MTLSSPFRRRAVAALAAVLLLPVAAPASAQQSSDDPSGAWSGSLDAGGQVLEIMVVLQATTGGWTGAIDIPAQNLTSFPLSNITVDGEAISFAMPAAPGNPVFRGTWNAAELTMSGHLQQGGRTLPFTLARVGEAPEVSAEPIDPETAAMVTGTWSGAMTAGGQTLTLVFHIDVNPDGALTATLDSPDQGQSGMPVNRIGFDGSLLTLTLEYVGATYTGTLSGDGASLDGTWSQGGNELPLRVERQ